MVKSIPEHEIIYYPHAIVTPDGVVFAGNGIESSSLYDPDHSDFFNGFYQRYYRGVAGFLEEKKGRYLLTFDAWSFGYFHWMTEFIPRLFKARHLVSECCVILPHLNNSIWNLRSALRSVVISGKLIPSTSYFSESVEAFNLQSVYKHKPRIPLKVKGLFLSAHVAPSGNYDDDTMRALRNFYYQHYQISSEMKAAKLIYATRRSAARRFVKNEQEVNEMLKSIGFEILELESFSFRDQVRMFSETKFFIGQHGAALTNLLFMREESFVMELKTEGDSQNLCYFSLANAMNVHYLYQFCKSDGKNVQDANIVVDVEEMCKNIKRALNQ
jgi:capsular polysaccharide biosynthesis protein